MRRLDALTQALARASHGAQVERPGLAVLPQESRSIPRGLYIWGAVGRGKTMLIDIFFEAAQGPPKRRAHFHAFMADVHARINQWREALKRGRGRRRRSYRRRSRRSWPREAWLLCFDEFRCATSPTR